MTHPTYPPRVWISNNSYRLVSGGNAPDASFIEFQDSKEYLSIFEHDAEMLHVRSLLEKVRGLMLHKFDCRHLGPNHECSCGYNDALAEIKKFLGEK